MIEKLFLICNAHLDPVWQWEWEEGAAEALSTFRIAAKFCEEYDGFVFCHNEALLYQWVEAYEPELFTRIQKLVKQKKWHIMGGWYLQPDCNMPSGEGFVRQILTGKKYFLEKFGVSPSTAVNVDPFGHSRGLVQIMKKCGYSGYLFMRPGDGDRYIKLPADEFKWIGYDDSEIIAVRIDGSYNSSRGCAAKKVREYLKNSEKQEMAVCLWGVGNHGGGPSRKDLEDLTDLIREKEKENVLIVHSTPEEYLAEIEKRKKLFVEFGGDYNSYVGGSIGSHAIEQINNYRCNKAFLGCTGIDLRDGTISTSLSEDAATKKAITNISDKLFLVTLNEKFKKNGSFKFSNLFFFSTALSFGNTTLVNTLFPSLSL